MTCYLGGQRLGASRCSPCLLGRTRAVEVGRAVLSGRWWAEEEVVAPPVTGRLPVEGSVGEQSDLVKELVAAVVAEPRAEDPTQNALGEVTRSCRS